MNPGIACLVGLGLSINAALGASVDENWPQWRGPHQDGVAPKADPPTTWSETKNVKWKVAIPGEGHATPIVWGDKIFVQTAVGTGKKPDAGAPAPNEIGQGQERPRGPGGQGGRPGGPGGRGGFGGQPPTQSYQFTVMCLDRGTGKTIWKQIAREALPHEGHHPTGSFASPSPVTDGENVYAYFGSQGLYCYDMNGNLKWSQDLGDMKIQNGFGEGSSPALHGDTIVVAWDNEANDFVAALNKKDGAILWKKPREERTAWSTPLIVEHDGKAQVITTATGKVRSYDLKTGELIWEHAGLTRNTIPSPVAANGVAYVMSGFQGNALYAIKLGKTGDLTDSDSVIWKHGKSTPYVPSPLLSNDRLYFFSNNNEVLSCFDANTGKANYEGERIEGIKGVYASPIAANGRVYLVGRNGGTVVIKDSDKLEVLAANSLDETFDASPVAVGKELFLRGHSNLYCIAEK
jgi:outer membrane protein assembly factor BamB